MFNGFFNLEVKHLTLKVCVCQLEVKMEDCLICGDSSDLVSVLRYEGLTSVTLSRLDQLVTKVTGLGGHHGNGYGVSCL